MNESYCPVNIDRHEHIACTSTGLIIAGEILFVVWSLMEHSSCHVVIKCWLDVDI